jgi:hypothetical protein
LDVLPEAVALHQNADRFGLPLPFTRLPTANLSNLWVQGYGATSFAFSIRDQYSGTQGIHSGIDFGNTLTAITDVYSICDGVVIGGRFYKIGNAPSYQRGGTAGTDQGAGEYGISIRCFMSTDVNNDGHRDLSNVVVTYNHLWSKLFDFNGSDNLRVIPAGTKIGTFNPLTDLSKNHLHLEVFIRGTDYQDFRNGFWDGIGAIRVNPIYFFNNAQAKIMIQYMSTYYPRIRMDIPPEEPANNLEIDRLARGLPIYGIEIGNLTQSTNQGDISITGASFWEAQTPTPTGIIEWPKLSSGVIGNPNEVKSLFGNIGNDVTTIEQYLLNFYPNNTSYIAPKCINLPINQTLETNQFCQL